MPPKEKSLLANFNLTLEKWQKIFDFQKGLCAICKAPLIRLTKKGKPAVINTDHDHKTGLLRGLLCFRCNQALRESMTLEFVKAVFEYLLHPPATDALGNPHYGLAGRVGTKVRRKLLAKLRRQKHEKPA